MNARFQKPRVGLAIRRSRNGRCGDRQSDPQSGSAAPFAGSANLSRKEPTTINNTLHRLLRRIAVSAALLLSVAPAALANAPSPSQMAREQHACAVVLGLDPSESPYDACVRSLDSSVSPSDSADLAQSLNSVGQASSIAAR
jgi:hypothetical protein